MWDKLTATHDRVTPMKQVAWEIQLCLLDLVKLVSMWDHINKMEILHNQILQARGKHLDEDIAITLLLKLPTNYSIFFTSLITSRRLTMITWDKLVPQVLDQEDCNDSVRHGGLQGRAVSVTIEALSI